jgi:RIP metalloprotease RseP
VTDLIEHPPSAPPPEAPATPPPAAPAPAWKGWLRLGLLVAAVASVGVFFGWPALAMVLAIVVSIFLHELGHYAFARAAGMKVTEFFIGFGPRLWSTTRGETEYGVKLIPAGAYVRIIGMHSLEEIDPVDEDRTYRAKPYRQRLPVILAGPFANFAIALALLFVVFVGFGAPMPERWVVDRVQPDSAAAEAGIEDGDRIRSVDGRPVGEFDDLAEVLQPFAGRPVTLEVERDGQVLVLDTTLGWRLDAAGAEALPPLRSGDQVRLVDGEPIASYDELATALADRPEGSATIVLERGGYPYEAEVDVPATLPEDGVRGFLGVGHEVPSERMGPAEAVGETGSTFGTLVVESVKGIGRFFSPAGLTRYWELVTTTPPSGETDESSAGPTLVPLEADAPQVQSSADQARDQDRIISILGVIQLGSQAADTGVVTVLFLLIMVNVFLGLVNLVPLLPFDGGHAAVATYEVVREKLSGRLYRVNMARLMPVAYAVVALMAFVGLSAMYLDIVDPVQIP